MSIALVGCVLPCFGVNGGLVSWSRRRQGRRGVILPTAARVRFWGSLAMARTFAAEKVFHASLDRAAPTTALQYVCLRGTDSARRRERSAALHDRAHRTGLSESSDIADMASSGCKFRFRAVAPAIWMSNLRRLAAERSACTSVCYLAMRA